MFSPLPRRIAARTIIAVAGCCAVAAGASAQITFTVIDAPTDAFNPGISTAGVSADGKVLAGTARFRTPGGGSDYSNGFGWTSMTPP